MVGIAVKDIFSGYSGNHEGQAWADCFSQEMAFMKVWQAGEGSIRQYLYLEDIFYKDWADGLGQDHHQGSTSRQAAKGMHDNKSNVMIRDWHGGDIGMLDEQDFNDYDTSTLVQLARTKV